LNPAWPVTARWPSCPDGTILCLFEQGKPDGTDTDDFLTLVRFDLEWLTDGRDRA
jgi:hypothetical protein